VAKLDSSALTVKGGITIASGATLDANSININLAGNWSNSGTFIPGTGKLTLNGTGGQTMSGSTFYDLEINDAAGVTLLTDETVSHQLILTNGLVTTGSNSMIVGASATIASASSASYINGKLAQVYSGTGSKT